MKQKIPRKYYFAYGSNLNLLQMKYRCPNAIVIGATVLKDFRLVFNGQNPCHSYLTIEECPGSYVPIGIFSITKKDEQRLDAYEGYPKLYAKKNMTLPFNTKEIHGLIYVMNQNLREVPPSSTYYYICSEGYNDFEFDEKILKEALIRSYENKNKILTYHK